MMRLRPFLSGPMKLSKDPVPSAKAASAQQQSSRATTNAFRHFGTSHDWREEIRLFITQYLYVILVRPARRNYVCFLCYIWRAKSSSEAPPEPSLPRPLAYGVSPYELVYQSNEVFRGSCQKAGATAPVRTEPHPTFPCYLADGVIFHKIGRPSDKMKFMGDRLKGRMTRKARL
jgi:hypothetical protein